MLLMKLFTSMYMYMHETVVLRIQYIELNNTIPDSEVEVTIN